MNIMQVKDAQSSEIYDEIVDTITLCACVLVLIFI